MIALLLACAPKIDPGPIPAVVAEQPPAAISVAGEGTTHLARRVGAGAADDPPGREGAAALWAWGTALRLGGTALVTREWVTVEADCPEGKLSDCAAALIAAVVAGPDAER